MKNSIEDATIIIGGLVEIEHNQRCKYAEHIKGELESIFKKNHPVKYHQTDIGMGASTEALIFIIPALGYSVFLQGKPIEDNLAAWLNLYKKVKKLLHKEKQNNGIYVSLPVATGLVVAMLGEDVNNLSSIEIISHTETPIGVAAGVDGKFSVNPERVYTFVALTNSEMLHFVGIRSNTEIIYHEKLDANEYYI